jgi:FKBP-type peptidyl-prolyl cis-trans isomerase SlyD
MIQDGKVVTMLYTLKDSEGEILDQAGKDDAFVYLHGGGQIVPGLENALKGLIIGSKKEVVVSPEEGYGELNPELRFNVKRDQFQDVGEIDLGMQFQANHPSGQVMLFSVEAIEGDEITVDANHPLAGESLHFSVEITDIRDATDDEMNHGHAHGPDGEHIH